MTSKREGVPKQMPMLGAGRDQGTTHQGIQSYRNRMTYAMTSKLKSLYPYPGGKRDIAAEFWRRIGDVPNYVEPFAGSAVVCLQRPHDLDGKTETLNDADGFICNALRSIAYAPEETAYWCDWPVSECDLTATHLWLKAQRPDLTARLFADPDYCDPRIGGRWLWGIASWIGDGWCVADGPWVNIGGRMVDRRTLPEREQEEGVGKRMPEIGAADAGNRGHQNNRGVQAYRNAPGVPRKMPIVSASGVGADSGHTGVQRKEFREDHPALLAYFERLAHRLRRVRLLCGDWQRAVKDSITVNHGTTGLLLDPPYPSAEHDMAYHGDNDIWYQVADWAIAHGDDPRLRICVCGYFSDATDALFPATWTRYRWEARGGYSNQSKNGRGRTNAKRECCWFSPFCLQPSDEAKRAFSQPITAREADYTGTLFAALEDAE